MRHNGRIPSGVRPYLRPLVNALVPEIGATRAVQALATAFGVSESAMWKAMKRSGE